MSDVGAPQTPPRAGAPRWMKVLLVVSLALNLLIIGAVLGAALTGGGKWRGSHGPGGVGALTTSLSEDDRKVLKRRMARALVGDRDARQGYRAALFELLTQLRAPNYDAEAVAGSMARIRDHAGSRLETGQGLLVERLGEISAAERRAYADRLEEALRRRKR